MCHYVGLLVTNGREPMSLLPQSHVNKNALAGDAVCRKAGTIHTKYICIAVYDNSFERVFLQHQHNILIPI
jgi:hypothetical protein